MPAQTTKSSLFQKYGNKLNTAVQKHVDDPTEYGAQRLPGGISNGVAQLYSCKFGQYKSGQYVDEFYFQAMGTVLEPEFVTTKDNRQIKVAGLQTMLMIPVCDTKNAKNEVTTQEEHVQQILNEMRKLAGEEYTRGASGADLEGLAAGIEKAKPYFKFATRESPATLNPDGTVKYEARVWESWYGAKGLEDYTPPEPGGVADSSGPVDTNGEAAHTQAPAARTNQARVGGGARATAPATTARAAANAPARPATSRQAPPPVQEEPEATGTDPDADGGLTSLAEAADGGDGQAQAQLKAIAIEKGVDEAIVEDADSWGQVVDMIVQAETGGQSEPAPEPEPEPEQSTEPEKGQVYLHNPVTTDPKTKRKLVAKKSVQVEVTAVDKKNHTVTLVDTMTRKQVYKGVAWDDLKPV